jgi:hypothetical protein
MQTLKERNNSQRVNAGIEASIENNEAITRKYAEMTILLQFQEHAGGIVFPRKRSFLQG